MMARNFVLWPLGLSLVFLVAGLGLGSAADLSYAVASSDKLMKMLKVKKGPDGSTQTVADTVRRESLTVRRTKVVLSGGTHDFEASCSAFLAASRKASGIIKFNNHGTRVNILVIKNGVNISSSALKEISVACGTQQAEEPQRLQLDREGAAKARAEQARMESERASREQLEREEEARREQLEEKEAARREQLWKEELARRAVVAESIIFDALRAAEEPDPFASVRGAFNLSGSDSRQWKTSVLLPGADKCGLIKTPSADPNIASAWTLACTFTSFHNGVDLVQTSGEIYERIVTYLQRVLKLQFQPDERATNINQVFFADPARPKWRIYVTKVSESSVGVAIVAVTSIASASPAFPNVTPFSAVHTVLPIEPTVRDEVEKIRLGEHGAMPPAERAATGAPAGSGRTTMTVKNSTAYELSVFFDGPVSTKLTLAPGGSQDVDLAAGGFHVAGRVAAPNVLPFYGEEAYAGSARYSMTFYIAP
jgi:hypothetical protein